MSDIQNTHSGKVKITLMLKVTLENLYVSNISIHSCIFLLSMGILAVLQGFACWNLLRFKSVQFTCISFLLSQEASACNGD